MNDFAEAYDDFEAYDGLEAFDDLEVADERSRGTVRGRRIFVPGGLASATLHTPKGAARLNLPSPVPTLTQFRTLERAVSANSQRLAGAAADLRRVRQELAMRRKDQSGQGMSTLFFALLTQKQLRDDLAGHTHVGSSAAAQLPAGTGSSFSTLLPLLLLQPGVFGQAGSGSQGIGGQDGLSPLMLIILLDVLK